VNGLGIKRSTFDFGKTYHDEMENWFGCSTQVNFINLGVFIAQ